jgi:hypothetical protein
MADTGKRERAADDDNAGAAAGDDKRVRLEPYVAPVPATAEVPADPSPGPSVAVDMGSRWAHTAPYPSPTAATVDELVGACRHLQCHVFHVSCFFCFCFFFSPGKGRVHKRHALSQEYTQGRARCPAKPTVRKQSIVRWGGGGCYELERGEGASVGGCGLVMGPGGRMCKVAG